MRAKAKKVYSKKDKNISVRPPKGEEGLKGDLLKVLPKIKEVRTLNELCVKVLRSYAVNQFPLLET